MFYTLYNKSNKIHLKHPKIGMWFTDDKKEAEEMLVSCHEYLKASNLEFMIENIILAEFANEDELSSISYLI